jgi:Ca2+-binding RTX toxin-like protein
MPLNRSRLIGALIGLAATVWFMTAPPADAAPNPTANTVSLVDHVLTFTAGSGKTNKVTIDAECLEDERFGGLVCGINVTDPTGILMVGPPSPYEAGCSSTSPTSIGCVVSHQDTVFIEKITVILGDMNDSVVMPTYGVGVHSAHLDGGPGNDLISGATSDTTEIGGAGNDTLISSFGLDLLIGGAGADSLYGGSSNDVLVGGAGADYLAGGDDVDTVSYADHVYAVKADLDAAAHDDGGAEDGILGVRDTIGAGVENITGGSGADQLTGNALDNALSGGPGADQLSGLGGNDSLLGGTGADRMSGGTGVDEVSYADHPAAVTVDIDGSSDDGNVSDGFLGVRDNVVTDVENLTGGPGNDKLTGSSANNIMDGRAGADAVIGGGGSDHLLGGPGNDQLSGLAGNDSLEGDADADSMSGGAGIDTVTYAYLDTDPGSSTCVPAVSNANAVHASADGVTGDDGGAADGSPGARDSISLDVENLVGGDGPDELVGNNGSNHLEGGQGDDTLQGMGGNDLLDGGPQADKLSGGAGVDEVYYLKGRADLTGTPGDDGDSSLTGDDMKCGGPLPTSDGPPPELDTIFIDVENLTMQFGGELYGNAFDNVLKGGGDASVVQGGSVIHGGDGDDTILGGSAHDSLFGEGGDDVISAYGDNDDLYGGTGYDVLNGGENWSGGDHCRIEGERVGGIDDFPFILSNSLWGEAHDCED